jgi:hypothetical protein
MSTHSLGVVSDRRNFSNFVGNNDPVDRINFRLTSAGSINLGLLGLSADADLRLFRGSSSSPGAQVGASSAGGTTPDSLNYRNLAAGNYFAEVRRFRNANTSYTLRLSRSTPSDVLAWEDDLGALGSSVITRTRNAASGVNDNNTSDIYRFTLGGSRAVNIALTGLTRDADLRLIRDSNGNGFADANEVVASSSLSGTNPDSINLRSLAGGTYLVQVRQFSNNSTGYSLRLSSNTPNNLIAPQDNLGVLGSNVITRSGSINDNNTADMYRFSLNSASAVNLALTGLSRDADLALIRDANGNGVVDSSEVIASSSLGGTTPDSINLRSLAAGTYYVQVRQFSANSTGYTLRLSKSTPSNLIAEEANLGTLGSSVITRTGSVGDTNTSDIYRFNLSSTGALNIALTGLTRDADLHLIRDANGNGIVDSGDVIASSSLSGTRADTINLRSAVAGTYFVQVRQFSSNSTGYSLRLSNSTPSNLLGQEDDLGRLSGASVTRSGSINSNDTSDIYRFDVGSTRNVSLRLSGLSQDLDLRLVRDSNNNGIADSGDLIFASRNSGTAVDQINRSLRAGTYFAQVYQFGSNSSNYQLRIA